MRCLQQEGEEEEVEKEGEFRDVYDDEVWGAEDGEEGYPPKLMYSNIRDTFCDSPASCPRSSRAPRADATSGCQESEGCVVSES